MGPRLLKAPRPLNIRRLIEARLDLHQDYHLLAGARRLDQVTGDARGGSGAVER